MLRAHPEWPDPVFLVGADQFCDFLAWKEPNEVLRLARLGVATRPGFPAAELQAVLDRIDRPDRVVFFEMEPIPVASSELRERLEAGESVGADVPSGAASIIESEGLYRI
jgi:nicotinate-nucleotide adenylyltransferase